MSENRYVALLRGVNVGGITVKSAPLAEVFRSLGYDDVKTVLASGNVLFTTSDPAAALKRTIEKGLADAFGYDAWIVLTDQQALGRVIDGFPFDESDGKQPYVVFSSDGSALEELIEFATSAGLDDSAERVLPGDGVIYWEVTRGESTNTAFAKELAKKRYKQLTTTRNLRTLRKLL